MGLPGETVCRSLRVPPASEILRFPLILSGGETCRFGGRCFHPARTMGETPQPSHPIHSFPSENTLFAVFLCEESSSKMASRGISVKFEIRSHRSMGWGKDNGSEHREADAPRRERRAHSLRLVFEISRRQQRCRACVPWDLSRVQDAGACPLGDQDPVGGKSRR